MKLDVLNTPYQIGKVTIPNRYAVSPMTIGSEFTPEGEFSDTIITYYTERAKGGFGLLVTGAMVADAVVDPNPASPSNHKEAFIESGKRFTESIHQYDTKIFAQITMGLGRNYPTLKAPSEMPVYAFPNMTSPALTKEEILLKIQQVVNLSKCAKEAGFDGVEVHAMHWGYLLDQFAMAWTNHRDDEFGGSIENRLRAVKMIVEGIKKECGEDFPVSIRFAIKSFVKGVNKATLTGEEEVGRTIEEATVMAEMLESFGYDCLNIDTGIYDSFYYACPPMYMPQSFMMDLVKQWKPDIHIPVITGGRMNDYEACAKAIEEGLFDAVTLGRPSLADPFLPNKVFSGNVDNIRPCLACNLGCFNRLLAEGKPASCAVNPQCAREAQYALKPIDTKKKIAVIGGGVAGMEAARVATIRGHEVEIYEASDHLGGHLIEAGAHDFKVEVKRLNEWYKKQLKDLNITVHYNTPVTKDNINDIKADTYVIASGSTPTMIPGFDQAMISLDAINHPENIGQKVVVIGGGLVGCELAYDLLKANKEVTVVEALPEILSAGMPAPIPNRQMIGDLFEYHHATVLTNTKVKAVKDNGVVVEKDGNEETIMADTVISAIGFKPDDQLSSLLEGKDVHVIGDAKAAKTIMNAIWEGYELGNQL